MRNLYEIIIIIIIIIIHREFVLDIAHINLICNIISRILVSFRV